MRPTSDSNDASSTYSGLIRKYVIYPSACATKESARGSAYKLIFVSYLAHELLLDPSISVLIYRESFYASFHAARL